ncbi:MAG TPA: hypothetical protein V6D14_31070 [Coleofasciculaceae cyanobacterium]|jgi:hypothetical protein
MAFIKVGSVVINTLYIAVVKLDSKTLSGENGVSLLVAIPQVILLDDEAMSSNTYHYEWMEFTGKEAKALQDYFSSFNNVIDLIPPYQEAAPA